MRTLIPLLALLLLPATLLPAASNAELAQIQTVYLLPMANGLDQYLANRITAEQIFQVVTDPKRADAVFTDQIGAGLEQRLEELYPPEKPAEEKEEKPAEDTGLKGDVNVPRVSSFSRGKGNLFLVDLKSRRVVWSVYERPKNISPDQLDKTCGRVVSRLKKALEGK